MPGEPVDLNKAMEDGDARALLRGMGRAMLAEGEGRYCACPEPDIFGRKSTICFGCGLVNQAAIAAVEARMLAPHPYEIADQFRGRLGENVCCDLCAMPRPDPRHAQAVGLRGPDDAPEAAP